MRRPRPPRPGRHPPGYARKDLRAPVITPFRRPPRTDEAEFAKEAQGDRFGAAPGAQLVPDLRGKDMIFFLTAYGSAPRPTGG
ncbi:hypothetical protein GCM10022384_25420 [Streptomyces marokkonensis]|uniref:Uncharacterized protein n=1 Tax=Streptomyces marokkonensis TaxID=324855 RepID=A0ABP7PZ16_9ACTN